MQVLEWAARFPEQIRGAVCLASAARLTAQGIAFNCVGRRAIVTDPNFHSGDYYDKPAGPNHGLALARMVAHITYLSEASIEKKFGRRSAACRAVSPTSCCTTPNFRSRATCTIRDRGSSNASTPTAICT